MLFWLLLDKLDIWDAKCCATESLSGWSTNIVHTVHVCDLDDRALEAVLEDGFGHALFLGGQVRDVSWWPIRVLTVVRYLIVPSLTNFNILAQLIQVVLTTIV